MIEVVAEIGMTHDGSLGQAKAMIDAAAEAGVNAVKFQTHIAEAETLRNAPTPPYFKDETRWDYFKRTAFTLEQHKLLFAHSQSKGVEFFSSPFSHAAIELLEQVGVKTYKVPSGEVTNLPYLVRLAQTGKRLILSSGMSTWEELDLAVKTLKENGCGQLVILQCTSEYPCPPEQAGLNIMAEISQRYNCPVGFSDHTIGTAVPVTAAVMGATFIEKHFTLSKKMYGPDAKNSATPEEFAQLVRDIRAVELLKSHPVNKDAKANSLKHMKVTFEKSIVAARDLPVGHVLTEADLAYKKPGDGISSRHWKETIGKKITRAVEADHKFAPGDLS
jgi:N,N'-diacetyllegionaminate synthase